MTTTTMMATFDGSWFVFLKKSWFVFKVSRPIESIDLEPELELHIARETRRLTEERDEWLAARRKAITPIAPLA